MKCTKCGKNASYMVFIPKGSFFGIDTTGIYAARCKECLYKNEK